MNSSIFKYALIQYCHDSFSDERINVGVLVESSEAGIVKVKFCPDLSRATCAYPDLRSDFLRRMLNSFESAVMDRYCHLLKQSSKVASLDELVGADDGAIRLSATRFGRARDISDEAEALLRRHVSDYAVSFRGAEVTLNRGGAQEFQSIPVTLNCSDPSNDGVWEMQLPEEMRA